MLPISSTFTASLSTWMLTVGPGLFFVWYVNSRDDFAENWHTVARFFLAGVLAVLPVTLWSRVSMDTSVLASWPSMKTLWAAFGAAALPEETCKLLALLAMAQVSQAPRRPLSLMVWGIAVALGFATLENIFYVVDDGASTALVRALTAVPCHGALGAIMGAYVAQALYHAPGSASRRRAWCKAWFVPVLLHGLYNFPLMAIYEARLADGGRGAFLLAMLTLLLLVFWARLFFLRISRLAVMSY